jgi:hypothetical protein
MMRTQLTLHLSLCVPCTPLHRARSLFHCRLHHPPLAPLPSLACATTLLTTLAMKALG